MGGIGTVKLELVLFMCGLLLPRVALLVQRLETSPIDVGINLRRHHAGVAQQFLNNAKIGTAFQQMGREAMSQGVRADLAGNAGR